MNMTSGRYGNKQAKTAKKYSQEAQPEQASKNLHQKQRMYNPEEYLQISKFAVTPRKSQNSSALDHFIKNKQRALKFGLQHTNRLEQVLSFEERLREVAAPSTAKS